MSGEAKIWTGESGTLAHSIPYNNSVSLIAHREYIWDSEQYFSGRWTP